MLHVVIITPVDFDIPVHIVVICYCYFCSYCLLDIEILGCTSIVILFLFAIVGVSVCLI